MTSIKIRIDVQGDFEREYRREMPAVPRIGDTLEIEDFDLTVETVNWTPDSGDEDVVLVVR